MASNHAHICPPITKGTLKFEALQAAKTGNVDKVKTFLDDGGDVNGGDSNGMPMIFAACEQGRTEVVRLLLKNPELHLNTRHMGVTALAVSCVNGHEDCVKMLIESDLKCSINLRVKCGFKNKKPLTAFSAAASAKQWNVFKLLLKIINSINPEEINDIVSSALDDDQWDIIQQLMQMDLLYQGTVFHRLIREAHVRQMWDVILQVFQKCLQRENHTVLSFLNELLLHKDWTNLESLFKIIDETAKIDVPLTEALREKRYQDAEELLKAKTQDKDVMSSSFLVACIGGASEEIGEILKSHTSSYSAQTLKYGLLLASAHNRVDILPLLLKDGGYSYHLLSRAYAMASFYDCLDTTKLLKFAIADKACGIFPRIAKCLQIDIAKAVMDDDDDV